MITDKCIIGNFERKKIARLFMFEENVISNICLNLTNLYNKKYPNSFVTWDYLFGVKGSNIVLYLWKRIKD